MNYQIPKVPYVYLIPVIYLAVWSTVFGVWGFWDGAAVFETFGLNLSADDFVLQNSGARYLGIASCLWFAIIVFRTSAPLYTALVARIVMDLFDLVAGIRTGVLESVPMGILQSFLMFIGPALAGFYLIHRFYKKKRYDKK